MSFGHHWIRYAAMQKLESILQELIAAGKLDQVMLRPASRELNPRDRAVQILPGEDSHSFEGQDVELEVTIRLRVFGPQTSAEGAILSLERLIAEIRDALESHVHEFHVMDPPGQLDGASVVDDPEFSLERDLSSALIEVRIRSH